MQKALSKKTEVVVLKDTTFPKVDGLIIDWVYTPNKKNPSKEFAHQAFLTNEYIKKGVKTVIFDKHMSITDSEYKWLSKFNTMFFEPALNNRRFFGYLPHWIGMDDNKLLDLEETTSDRKIDLGYIGPRNIDTFEKYYIEYMKKYNHRVVSYKDVDLDWKNVKCAIAIDSNYNIGHMSSHVLDALSNGCMVLCPVEHKYFTSMFYGNVVEEVDSIEYWIKHMTHEMRFASVLSIYKIIEERFPEFTLKYAVDKVLVEGLL